MKLTRAVTHIRLDAITNAKVAALDAVAAECMALSQQSVTRFSSRLSQRWPRVASQHAAGIARSWRSTHRRAQEGCADPQDRWLEGEQAPAEGPPRRKPWQSPTLRPTVIQANANVALLQPSRDISFASWLRVSTLEQRQPIVLPVTLSASPQRRLAGRQGDSSGTLTRHPDGWWLTWSDGEDIPLRMSSNAPVMGVDGGMTRFLTTSTGKPSGSFQGKRAQRQQRDRAKRRRKAKPARSVRQEITRAVNEGYRPYAGSQIACEQRNLATMRCKARRMNAYLYASNRLVVVQPPAQLSVQRA